MNIIQDKLLIKRSSKKYIDNLLANNPDWNILDIGCGYGAHEKARVICDVQDLSKFYKDKNFVKLDSNILPFKDNEFDFVIASHVLEHVKEVDLFINELERVSTRGYIEVPTKLEDNLVFENKKDHIWHLEFDDINYELIISKKIQYFEPILTVSTIKKFSKIFKQSLVLELYWENRIKYKKNEENILNEKFSRFSLLKKFISKKFRTFLRKK